MSINHEIKGLEIVPGGITAPRGFQAAAAAAEIRYPNRPDLALICSEVPAVAAAVYTRNKVQAAPLIVSREHLTNGQAQAVVINAGIANAATGQQGLADARQMAYLTAEALQIAPENVVVASTGVIGQLLPMERVEKGIRQAATQLSPAGGAEAAQAIMTTDTRRKEVAVKLHISGCPVTIGGMAKGSGMVHPDMATMLGFITTDAAIEPGVLQQALKASIDRSFNLVTVDGDTSTNDMVLLLANGRANNPRIAGAGPDLAAFQAGLDYITVYLAKEIARDGEGATRLIEVRVINAPSLDDGKKAARAIAGSSLVKSAVFGRDANWGRILAALGYSGADFEPQQVDIYLGEVLVARDGAGLAFDEELARQVLEQETVVITVDLKAGPAAVTAWGCDLTFDYVKINASYRS